MDSDQPSWSSPQNTCLHQSFLITLGHSRPNHCVSNLMSITWESYPHLPISHLAFITKTWHRYGLHGPISVTIFTMTVIQIQCILYMTWKVGRVLVPVAEIVMKPPFALAPLATGVSRLANHLNMKQRRSYAIKYEATSILTWELSPPCRMVCDLLWIISSILNSWFQSETRLPRSGSRHRRPSQNNVVLWSRWVWGLQSALLWAMRWRHRSLLLWR